MRDDVRADPAMLRDTLLRQFDTAWSLTQYHLTDLGTDACLWRPASAGLHVWPSADGSWRADWPSHEGYTLGPPSIAWITWHMGFWWTMVLDHTFGARTATRESVSWPGDADGVRAWLQGCATRWRTSLETLPAAAWTSADLTQWPFRDRPFADVVAWANVELMKNAAELGYARFLHAVRER